MIVQAGGAVAALTFLIMGALVAGDSPAPALASAGPITAELTAGYAYKAGFRGPGLVLAVAVAAPESGYDPASVGTNPPTSGCPNGRDRGLWQINDCYHPDVSDQCAFDPACAADAAFRISGGGTVWTPWAAFKGGLHLPFMASAQTAATQAPFVVLPGPLVLGAQALPVASELLSEARLLAAHHGARNGRAGYPAWDLPIPAATPVYAIAAGTVHSVTGARSDCGNGLIVVAQGHTDTYCHGSAVVVTAGSTVTAGQRIMLSGSTGESTGPHLHLQVQVEGRLVCPQSVLYAWFRGVPASMVSAPSTGCHQ